MKQKILIYSAVLVLMAAAPALAQPSSGDLMPAVSPQSAAQPTESLEGETHPMLTLSPDKSELVRLDRDAHSVVIGNSSHVAVMLDTPRLAVVIPRNPGATYFTVLDKDGKIVMQRHVVVGAPKKDYVRIRRSCGNVPDGVACQPTSVYFCPDMCHEIGTAAGENGGNASSGAE
jgi:Flp pilus assembly secretin CpaC